MESTRKKRKHTGVLITKSQKEVKALRGMLCTLSESGNHNCPMVSKPNARSRDQSKRQTCELCLSGSLPASLKSSFLFLYHVPRNDIGANLSSSTGWRMARNANASCLWPNHSAWKWYSLRLLLDHIHIVATTASVSVTLLVRPHPKHNIQIPLPHLKWDILLTPESQQNGEGSEN